MNKFKFSNNGIPICGNDFLYIQKAVQDALNGILPGLTSSGAVYPGEVYQNFIVSGCEVSGSTTSGITTFNVSEGWVYLAGELLHVSAQTIAAPITEYVYFELSVANDQYGSRQTVTGSSVEVYEKRKAVLASSATTPPPTNTMSLKHSYRLKSSIDTIWSLRSEVTALNGEMGNVEMTVAGHTTSLSTLHDSLLSVYSELQAEITQLIDVTNSLQSFKIKSGMIVDWCTQREGVAQSIPNGWAVCNGSNGTDDLLDYKMVKTTHPTAIYEKIMKL